MSALTTGLDTKTELPDAHSILSMHSNPSEVFYTGALLDHIKVFGLIILLTIVLFTWESQTLIYQMTNNCDLICVTQCLHGLKLSLNAYQKSGAMYCTAGVLKPNRYTPV